MKITRHNLKLIIEQFLLEKKIKYVDKSLWVKNKEKIIETHEYGKPTKESSLAKKLLKKWPGKKINQLLCETCHAFDTSKSARSAGVGKGKGYCIAFDFACSGKNSCTGWLPKNKK